MTKRTTRSAAVAVALLCAAATAPAAGAAITASQITAPGPTRVAIDYADPAAALPDVRVQATTTGAVTGDRADLVCVSMREGVRRSRTVVNDLPLGEGGTFDATTSFVEGGCRLAVVPFDFAPSADPAPFAGPTVTFQEHGPLRAGTPARAHDLELLHAGPLGGARSSGSDSCGPVPGVVDAGTLNRRMPTLFCSAYTFANFNDRRSTVLVDGVNAFGPATAERELPASTTGKVGRRLAVTFGEDGLGHEDAAPFVRCAPEPAYLPYTNRPATECASVTPVGVEQRRTTTVDRGGRRVVVRDRWVATDGRPHTVDVLLSTDVRTHDSATGPLVRAPGDGTFRRMSYNDVVDVPAGVSTVLVKPDADLPDEGNARAAFGALSFGERPDLVAFGNSDFFYVRYRFELPAGGTRTFSSVLEAAPTLAAAEQAKLDNEALLQTLQPPPPPAPAPEAPREVVKEVPTAGATTVVEAIRRLRAFATKVSPGRDARAPYRFSLGGTAELPPSVRQSACKGQPVVVTVTRGKRRVRRTVVDLSAKCAWRLAFRAPRKGTYGVTARVAVGDDVAAITSRKVSFRAG
jgi:hypothetical protein